MLSAPLSRRSRFSGVSSATTRPFEMITMREHVAATSGRMCVLRMTVCSPPSDLIRLRVSMICLRVEAAGRLVQDQHRRIAEQRLGQADALSQALGQLADLIAGAMRDARLFHRAIDLVGGGL